MKVTHFTTANAKATIVEAQSHEAATCGAAQQEAEGAHAIWSKRVVA